jgi:hypothetical protein
MLSDRCRDGIFAFVEFVLSQLQLSIVLVFVAPTPPAS